MLTKQDLIKRLRNDPMYRDALKLAKTDEERRRIMATAEGFLSGFIDSLLPLANKIAQDPEFASQLQDSVRRGIEVIKSDTNDIILTVSGSNQTDI